MGAMIPNWQNGMSSPDATPRRGLVDELHAATLVAGALVRGGEPGAHRDCAGRAARAAPGWPSLWRRLREACPRSAAFVILAIVGGVLPGSVPPSQAQPANAAASGPLPGWQFTLTPYVWLPALGGSIQTPLPNVGNHTSDLESGDVLTSLSAVPVMVAAEARYDRFALVGDFVYAALESDIKERDLLFSGGHARAAVTVGTILGMARVAGTSEQPLEFGAGVRIYGVSAKVSLNSGLIAGQIAKNAANWADPVIAVRHHLRVSPQLGITLYGDVGGFGAGSDLSWQALGALDYRFSDSVSAAIGWRYLTFDRVRHGFGLDLDFNGPFLSLTFRF
ncbi:hypothetical protein E0493_09395 [Roseomonas sp. M0104]|uniref:Uncharacterized protein n=1 Tax=Teichococcus coralli TaxID=2545983 RepID=A0A845B7F1_9PROT|nr:hypothetical protein [Pseudoroseomonas coralli]MXP63563.1 hypothetical protein [Pseudoroseomonas coralli]